MIRKIERVRVSASIEKSLMDYIDQLIEEGTYRSRAHGIEQCIRHVKGAGVKQHIWQEKGMSGH